MPGALYFGCGRAADEADVWRMMLHRPTTRIVYWPFALPASMLPSADEWLRGNLDQLGVGYELQTWTSLAGRTASELNADHVDLLFVGGGNTFRLLSEIRRAGFVGAARQFNQSGGDYYGGSAGAVAACDTVAIALGHDDNGPGLRDMTALGLIPGVTILPHFDGSQVAVAAAWAAEHHATVLGVPESIGLRCLDGRILVLGAGRLTRLTPSAIDEFAPGDTVTVDSSAVGVRTGPTTSGVERLGPA